MTIHPQAQASRATVDADLAELLELVWAADLTTEFSCQGGPPDDNPDAMIMFGTVADALRFLRSTMDRSYLYNQMRLELAEPQHNPDTGRFRPVRATVHWPHTITAALTDVWADRQPAGGLYDRRSHPVHEHGFD